MDSNIGAVARHTGSGLFPHRVAIRNHHVAVDEPREHGGEDTGPDPTELLAAALASCTAMTMRAYAGRKGWVLGDATVEVTYTPPSRVRGASYDVRLRLPPTLDEQQRQRVAAIAERCPVRRALTQPAHVVSSVVTTDAAPSVS